MSGGQKNPHRIPEWAKKKPTRFGGGPSRQIGFVRLNYQTQSTASPCILMHMGIDIIIAVARALAIRITEAIFTDFIFLVNIFSLISVIP
jgi:hypothetical protein